MIKQGRGKKILRSIFPSKKKVSWFGFIKSIDILPTFLFILSAIIWRTPYYFLGLYVMLPITIVYCFVKYNNIILKSKYWIPYLLLILWMLISSFLDGNLNESLRIMIPVIATFLLSFSVLSLSQEKSNNSKMLALGFVFLFVAILYLTVTSGNFSTDFNYADESERRQNTELNANQYAYFSLFAIMAIRLMLGRKKIKIGIYRIVLYFILAGVAFFVALMTASRQVLLLEIPVLVGFIYYDFILEGSHKTKIVASTSIILILILMLPYFIMMYDNSYLAVRASENVQEDSRTELLKFGIRQGIDNPIFGVGLGAETDFTHCTYTHLFARCGLPAMLIYIYILYIAAKEQFYRYKKSRNRYFLFYLFLVIVFVAANFFYSYIDQPYMLTILFLICGESNNFYKKYRISDRRKILIKRYLKDAQNSHIV